MTITEAGELLALMRATWPRLAPDEVADRLWLEDLAGCDRKPALEAFRSLRDSEDRVPAWSLFREAYHAQTRRFEPYREAIEAPDVPPPTEEQKALVHTLVAELKNHLQGRKSELDKVRREVERPSSDFDPFTPMFTYDEVYGDV